MKTIRNILIFLVFFAFFPSSVFAERKPLLPEKSLWSVVHDPPAAGKKWTTTYPLPKDRKVRGGLDTNDGTWPKNKRCVFMTTELVLPDDYEPGNLYAQYQHEDAIQIAINGTLVFQRRDASPHVYRKRVPNLLKPGKNIIAVYCDNHDGGRGVVNFALFMDDEPFMRDKMLFSPDHKWSYTFKNPGQNWTKTCPLPGGKMNFAPFGTNPKGEWPLQYENIWMTTVVTLPQDYKPGPLHAELTSDDNMWLYINGEEVLTRSCWVGWDFLRNIKNPLKPGKNIIAVRCFNHVNGYGHIGLDLYLEEKKADDSDDDSGFSMPTRRPKDPEDEGDEEDEEETPEPEDDLTETEKLIVKGMNFLKQGKEKPAVEALLAAAKADPEDFQVHGILAMFYLTKNYKPATALESMQVCVKIDAKNPCVLNNFGVAAMESKKYADALKAWQRLAKNYPTLSELQQNVGFLTELVDNKLVKLKDDERQKLETLFREVCGTHDVKIDKTAGFLLMPLTEGVGADPKYAEIFVQEYKRGKEKVMGNPYEVKRAYFQK